MSNSISTTTAFLMILTLSAAVNAGSVLYVDDDAPPNGDGTSWETAYRFLQDALTEAANSGVSELRIAQGVYRPDLTEQNAGGTIDPYATFELVDNVAIIGGYAGIGAPDPDDRDIDLYETVLSGYMELLQGSTECCYVHDTPGCNIESCEEIVCFYVPACCTNEWDELCVAVADTFCDMTCIEPTPDNCFHVVTVFESSATLDGLTIRDGDARWPLQDEERSGAGILNIAGDLNVINCTFESNTAYYGGNGGAIANFNSNPNLINCTFIDSKAHFGGAIYNNNSHPVIEACSFFISADFSASRGGAIFNRDSNPTITNCLFLGDYEINQEGSFHGDGIFNLDSSPQIIGCIFEGLRAEYDGGAIGNDDSDPLIMDCLFVDNAVTDEGAYPSDKRYGGAVFNEFSSNPTFIGCEFTRNFVGQPDFPINDAISKGGAVANLYFCNSTFIDCTFSENKASHYGGAIYTSGASDAVFDNCSFTDNQAIHYSGGAVVNSGSSESTYIDCDFQGNSAVYGGAFASSYSHITIFINGRFYNNVAEYGGAAVVSSDATPLFLNCLFNGNNALNVGGAVLNWFEGKLTIINSTIVNNSSTNQGGGISVGFNQYENVQAHADISNCILWNNSSAGKMDEPAQLFLNDLSTANINYSNLQGLTGDLGGIGNIGDDPLFVDIDGKDDIPGNEDDNLRLQLGSLAIDAAYNNAVPSDQTDLDEDGDTNEFTPIDLDGNPRFADVPKTLDTGCGVPVIVDMGAYEFQGNPIQPCFGDTDGDLIVNTVDLLDLFSTWGTCDGCCLADFDTNGVVNTSDLLILFANWGLCK